MESRDLFAAACLVFVIAVVMLKLGYGPASRRRRKPLAPDIRNGRVIVTGLSAVQVKASLAEFAKLYDLDAATFTVKAAGDALQVTWTRSISSHIALYLVNYLAYPADDTSGDRRAEAVGVIAVPQGIAPEGLAPGTLTQIFVPVGDTEHDLVHALAADGRAFRISFTRMAWEPIGSPKAPALAGKVAFALEG
ncbi:MAG: hypothetical protein KAF27_10890 [Porphyrobacter sp.]|nr:hypothetical protein [Porphyrobacter sp.]